MDLNSARMFVAVVQAGSLSAAADRIHVPLPTLSRRIRELEHQLKVQLFERSTRGARLTEAGGRLYEHAVRGVEAFTDGEHAILSDQARLKGRLRLSIPPAFEPWWALLRAFQSRYPDVELNIYTTERRVDLIQDGIDVALRVGDVQDDRLVARRIIAYRHVLVGSSELVTRLELPRVPSDLSRFPCAAWVPNIEAHTKWTVGELTVEPRVLVATNDYQQLRDLALTGTAITELPPFIARPHIGSGRLRVLLEDFPMPEQTINLLYPSHRYPSTIVRAYLDYCRDEAHRYF